MTYRNANRKSASIPVLAVLKEEQDSDIKDNNAEKPLPIVGINAFEMQPKTYSPEGKLSAQEFLNHFLILSNSNGWVENRRIQKFPAFLDEDCQKWYQATFGDQAPANWAALSAAFLAAYGFRRNQICTYARMNNRKMQAEEDLSRYFWDKLSLINQYDANMDVQLKIQHLIHGLKPSLIELIYPFNFLDVETLYTNLKLITEGRALANENGQAIVAKVEQNILALTEAQNVPRQNPRVEGERFNRPNGQNDSQQYQGGRGGRGGQFQGRRDSQFQGGRGGPGRDDRGNRDIRYDRLRNERMGQNGRNRDRRDRYDEVAQDQCRGCKGFGHWFRDCPQNQRNSQRQYQDSKNGQGAGQMPARQ